MDITLNDYAPHSLFASQKPQNDLFLFNSSSNIVRSRGVSQTLVTPLLSPSFNQEVRDIFNKESLRGVVNPILVGAIPFDLSQPCALFSPKDFECVKPLYRHQSPFADEGFSHKVIKHSFSPNKGKFVDIVNQSLSLFEDTRLKKVVLSKVLDLELDKPIDSVRLLANIMAQNPYAYHFKVPFKNSGIIGASPELLIKKQGTQVFSNPLAGSAKRSANEAEDKIISENLRASEKDQYEHRLVVEGIRSSLSSMVEDLNIPDKPSVISTPTMWHLSTQIEATLASQDITSVFDIIKKLHPTPAMCGTPTSLAKQSIHRLEPYDRQFFSGLVGWCDSQGNSEWAIAIRCAEVSENKVKLFAGAGIVPGSTAQTEWAETSAKMRTMLNALGIREGML